MNYEHISTTTEGHLFIVSIARPEKHNALGQQTHRELASAFDHFSENQNLWVAIITGEGDRAFCSGSDLSEVNELDGEMYEIPKSGYGGLTTRYDCNKPVIAAVNGLALGGGFEIVLACDLAVASSNATFGLPEPKVGVVAIAGGMHRLIRGTTPKFAMNMLLTGDSISAQLALENGLINEVVAPGEALNGARKLAEKIQRCSPLAIQATKQCTMGGLAFAGTQAAQLSQENGSFDLMEKIQNSEDAKEGVKAFVEKRAPVWTGT